MAAITAVALRLWDKTEKSVTSAELAEVTSVAVVRSEDGRRPPEPRGTVTCPPLRAPGLPPWPAPRPLIYSLSLRQLAEAAGKSSVSKT
jgi:hypothetical protein